MSPRMQIMMIVISVIAGLVAASTVYLAWGAVVAWKSRPPKEDAGAAETDDEGTIDEPE